MSKSTILSTGRITAADDIITVTYTEPADAPPMIFVRWPRDVSVTTPNRLPALAAAVNAVLAEAVAKLAAI
jgi:hypothetical protein